ncbi:hypothetical protein UC8_15660 [Roseimaritima ulvae]|uniref:Uncharacterized protein n=1 Tax=Roseimaritima ulvae TaxID=980254 RepID=A0A5B9QPH2_9BACT|nr:hypothetical protein UC8_15660 [Roseimaritima ulvae]
MNYQGNQRLTGSVLGPAKLLLMLLAKPWRTAATGSPTITTHLTAIRRAEA